MVVVVFWFTLRATMEECVFFFKCNGFRDDKTKEEAYRTPSAVVRSENGSASPFGFQAHRNMR